MKGLRLIIRLVALLVATCVAGQTPVAAQSQRDVLTDSLKTATATDSLKASVPADSLEAAKPADSHTLAVPADSLKAAKPAADRQELKALKLDRNEKASQVAVVASDSMVMAADSLATKVLDALQPAFKPEPIRALWLSLILPGAGQIYNHKYWKLPIIYGGFLGCAYALNWNGQMLRDYSQAYLDIMDTDPNTKSYEKMLPLNYSIAGREEQFKEIFKNKKNYYRKYRDMSIMAFAAVYALAVIDAYVDAELSSFDISEDLSLHVHPTVISPSLGGRAQRYSAFNHQGIGLSLCLTY